MKEDHHTNDMSEFIVLAEHRRTLLQESDRTAALLRRIERGRSVAHDDAEGAKGRLRRGVQRNYRSRPC